MKNEKTVTPEVKKTWTKPELELIDIQNGTILGGIEGEKMGPYVYDGVS